MYKPKLSSLTLIISLLLIFIPTSVLAYAGKALYVIGKVMVVSDSGDENRVKRTDEFYLGDTVVTNNRSQIQIRMSDGTLLAVRPNSQFRIDDYQHEKNVQTDKSHYRLIKGAFRSITGSIGKKNKASYMVSTPVGTIGIRGTDFSARLCDSDCGDANDGLYVGVMEGGITLYNDGGELDISPGDFGFIQDQSVEPSQLEGSPGDLLFAHTDTETHTEVIVSNAESNNIVESFESESSVSTVINNLISTITPVESAKQETEITEEDELIVVSDDTDIDIIDPIIPDPADTSIALPSTGIAIYSVASNTDPTDGVTTGTLDVINTHLTVDFVDPSATASIQANFNSNDWTGTTTQAMAIDSDGKFAGDLAVSIADPFAPSTGTGSLNGSLSGDTEATIDAPSNASLSYNMNDGSTNLTGDITLDVSTTGPSN